MMNNVSAAAQYDDIDGILRPSQNPYLAGHSQEIQLLMKMRIENHLAHALLFEGLHGIGKTTMAFHLAWQMLSDQPLNEDMSRFIQIDETCPHWRQITFGAHPGLLYISRPFDSKIGKFRTTITVEEIRKINHFMQHRQADGGWRIVIIDPADDMNRNSANALLKILEEPPRKTLFILISHHKGQLLPTIRSRCQTLHCQKLTDETLHHVLTKIAAPIGFDQNKKIEQFAKPNSEKNALAAQLVQQAQGSVRKAIMLFAFGGLEIASAVDEFLNLEKFNLALVSKLATVLSGRDAQIQFEHFTDHLLNKIGKLATQNAMDANLVKANQMAQLWHDVNDQIAQTQAYNLDRKNFILVLLGNIHQKLYP